MLDPRTRANRHPGAGYSLVEVLTVMAILTILCVGVASAFQGINDTHTENQSLSLLDMRGQRAMERITEVLSHAVTTDEDFAMLAASGDGFHTMQFRVVESVSGDTVTFDDENLVILSGWRDGSERCRGVILGRGPDLATVHTLAAGGDDTLGTRDDDTRASHEGDLPAVELLIPSEFAPSTGDMFEMEYSDASKVVTVRLRLNVQRRTGEFIYPDDQVFEQRVALRQ